MSPPPNSHDVLDIPTTIGPDAFAPMLGLARRAQVALADATLANIQEALSTAQQAVETTRNVTRDMSEKAPTVSAETSALAPALHTIAERQMNALEEMTTLAQKCTRAYLDLPSQLASCRSPHDTLGLQMRFWQGTATQCAESGRRMMNALAGQPSQAGPHVPTVSEVLGQRLAGTTSTERGTHREPVSGPLTPPDGGREPSRRGPDGRLVA